MPGDTQFQPDLTNCDREPIHIPGNIQPHGVLFACGSHDWQISHVSQNVEKLFGKPAEDVIGKSLDKLLGSDTLHDLINTAAKSDTAFARIRCSEIEVSQLHNSFDACLHAFRGRRIVELHEVIDAAPVASLDLVRAMVSRIKTAVSAEELWSQTVRQLRALIGFDRVMIYRFQHDGSGQVVAEARRSDLETFVNLRYPASDIPRQARELYKKNLIRVIADVAATPVPIFPQLDINGEALDLSFATLRAVSPIHIEYLKNMGVAATMTISIIIGGELWGLIACHHYSPKNIPVGVRSAADLFGQFFSVQLEALEQESSYDGTRAARLRLDALVAGFPTDGNLSENLSRHINDLKAILPCDGMGLWIDGIWHGIGQTPPPDAIPALSKFLDANYNRSVFITHELSQRYPKAADYAAAASGLLAIPLTAMGQNYLMYFRKEVAQTVSWAGDPSKPVTVGPFGERLTPRKSFAAWQEELRGRATPWTVQERLTAEALRTSLLEVVLRLREMVEEERRLNSERQNLLIAELNHRVKNILSLISALVKRGQAPEDNLLTYIRGLEGRIRALAFAHDLISKAALSDLRSLMESEIVPYRTKMNQITLQGPAVAVEAYAFPILALILHEMITNAIKYGSLSVGQGKLEINWHIDPRNQLVIEWTEMDGPPVQAPKHEGFGTVLIKKNVPFELGGETSITYELTGVKARFVIPAKHVGQVSDIAKLPPQPPSGPSHGISIEGLSILVLEDQMLIAMDAQAMLEEAGALHVDTVSNAGDALRLIDAAPPSAAILDINLGNATSFVVADELVKRNIPFIFATGYGENTVIQAEFRNVPVVSKPYSGDTLLACLQKALNGAVFSAD